MEYLKEGKTILCHPNCFSERYSVQRHEYAGLKKSKDEIEKKFDLKLLSLPYEIDENIIYLGEIPRENDFESKEFPTVYRDGRIDIVEDDTGIVVNTSKGLIIISGCAHSGICNMVEYAKKLTKIDKVYAVIGGFHLKEINEQLMKTIDYIKLNKISSLYLGHCTSDIVCEKIKEDIDFGIVEIMGAGMSYEL